MALATSSARLRPAWLGISLVAGSLSNVTVMIGSAWTGQLAAVGAVGVLLASYVVVLCVTRGLLGEWLLLTRSIRPAIAEEAAGAAVVLGFIAGVATLPIMLLLLPQQGEAAIILAVSFPILLFQDTLRYVTIARETAHHAAASDVLWLICAILATIWCLVTAREQTGWLLGSWIGGSAVGAGYLLLVSKLRPRIRTVRSFIRGDRALRFNLATDAMLSTGTLSVSIILSASIIGVAGVGIIRFLQTIFGPITLLFGVLYVEFVARSRRDPDGVAPWQAAGRMALLLTGATVGLTIILLAAPKIFGDSLGGEVLKASLALVMAFAGSQIAAGLGTAAATGLKLADRSGIAAKVRAIWAVGIVGGTALGGTFAGVVGYIWFATAVHLVAAAAWWYYLSASRLGHTQRGC